MITLSANFDSIIANISNAAEGFEQTAKDIVKKSTLNIEASAKMKAAVQSGKLRSSINSRFENEGMTGIVEATAAHAAFVEYDTRAHIIRAKNAKFLRFKMDGEIHFRKSVKHPGTKAQPFMRPAGEEERPHFEREMTEAVGRIL